MRGARPMRSTRRLQNLTGTLPRWWTITNRTEPSTPTLVSIYDEIGFYGVPAGEFLAELSGIDGDIDLHLNSPGGDVFDAIAIYNSLKARRGVVSITVDGLAASAASFIAQAASPGRLEMAPFSTMMIHDGFAAGIGNAADMRELAGQLDAASDNIAGIYAARTGKSADYWRAKMRATTWYKDHEAVTDGLADRIRGEDGTVRDSWDLTVYNAAGDTPIGDGWVMGADGQPRFDPDGDGDDDATPEGDTDHDYFDPDGNPIREIPPCPGMAAKTVFAPAAGARKATAAPKATHDADREAAVRTLIDAGYDPDKLAGAIAKNTVTVDNSAWDAAKAWHNGTQADDPEAFYAGICAGKKTGDPDTQAAWALPYKYHPDDPPNAAGVRAALGRLNQTDGLINKAEARETLESVMKTINPDYKPGDTFDGALLSAALLGALEGASK